MNESQCFCHRFVCLWYGTWAASGHTLGLADIADIADDDFSNDFLETGVGADD